MTTKKPGSTPLDDERAIWVTGSFSLNERQASQSILVGRQQSELHLGVWDRLRSAFENPPSHIEAVSSSGGLKPDKPLAVGIPKTLSVQRLQG